MSAVAGVVSAVVLVVVVSAWPAALLVATAAVLVDRWPARTAVQHRCGCASSGAACSHIAAVALSASTTTEGDPT